MLSTRVVPRDLCKSIWWRNRRQLTLLKRVSWNQRSQIEIMAHYPKMQSRVVLDIGILREIEMI
jgi:hypothetical protein